MTERSLLMSGPLVRATFAGTKTQTRRPVKHRIPPEFWTVKRHGVWTVYDTDAAQDREIVCPHGVTGDRLWIKETFLQRTAGCMDENGEWHGSWVGGVKYCADDPAYSTSGYHPDGTLPQQVYFAKRPSIHMPRWASRITLEICDVRVQRLQEITEEDARAEGVEQYQQRFAVYPGTGAARVLRPVTTAIGCYRQSFADAWNSIYGAGSFAQSPWVWAITFRIVEGAAK